MTVSPRLLHRIGAALGIIVFGVALVVLYRALREHRYAELSGSLAAIPAPRIAAAAGFVLLSYLALTGYDALGLRYVGHRLRYRQIAFASFIAYAFSNSVGAALLSGGSVRYRFYTAWGLSPAQVSRVVAFSSLTFWVGFLAVGGMAFVASPPPIPAALHLPLASARPLGALLLAVLAAYVALCAFHRRGIKVGAMWLESPRLGLAFAQVGVAAADWMLAAAALRALLPEEARVPLPAFLATFLLAQVAGLVSQVPGGLGVFETVVLLLLPGELPAPAMVGALLAFRALYYLLPLAAAALLAGTYELVSRRAGLERVTRLFGQWAPAVTPNLFAFVALLAGSILLISGVTPAVDERLRLLEPILPLPFIETSHFLGSLVGVSLLVLARALHRRLDAAFQLTVALLAAGVVLSLLKGFDYEEAVVLALLLAALLPCRHHFYRRALLLGEPFSVGWTAAIAVILLATAGIGLFAHKHVEYSGDLLWQFTLEGNAPRALRATIAALVAALGFAAARLLRPARGDPALPIAEDLARAWPVVAASASTHACLALTGDKALLWNDAGTAFLMYGVEGRSFVAMGDPVGPPAERAELAWRFRDLADRHDGSAVFYEIGPGSLPLCIDLGLSLLKLGEEARVDLASFSLDGHERKALRQIQRKVERDGYTFAVLTPEDVAAALPELRRISDAWLQTRSTREKGFSLGFFSDEYLRRFPAAVARREGEIVAFANLWLGGGKEEMSVDLMRYLPDASAGIMDYLFVELMLWGKARQHRWFNLGMAPLSGLQERSLAPLWSRVGAIVFRHGEHFYHFQGIRRYKEKFEPIWEPRYLAFPSGFALPRILANVAALISGGVKGIFAR